MWSQINNNKLFSEFLPKPITLVKNNWSSIFVFPIKEPKFFQSVLFSRFGLLDCKEPLFNTGQEPNLDKATDYSPRSIDRKPYDAVLICISSLNVT